MRILGKIVAAVLFVFFLFAAPSMADIKYIKIRSDNRPAILFQKFGFTQTGNVTVLISNVSVSSTISLLYDPSLVCFFLLSDESLSQILLELQQNPNLCVVHSKLISLLFDFRDLSPPPHSSFLKSYAVTVTNPGEYSLFFANCNFETFVTMDVRTEFYNTDDGTTKNYLSTVQTQFTSLYYIFFIMYLCFQGIWITVCLKNQRSVHRVHLLMYAFLIMKLFCIFCAMEDMHHLKITGYHNNWNILFHIFQFSSSVLSFTVIVLIGAGFSYLKPNLQRKEKSILVIVILLQVLASVGSVVIGETGPFRNDFLIWIQVLMWADVFCCSAVIFPTFWSIRSLKERSETDLKAASLFRWFLLLVIVYLFVTRIVVFELTAILVYKYRWMCDTVEEISMLVLYLVKFYMFRPVDEDEYSVLEDEGESEETAKMSNR